MVWHEYVEQADDNVINDYQEDLHEDEEFIAPIYMDIEDWTVWYSRDLMNMWFSLRSYTDDAGISNFVMPFATYTAFCEFCYRHSDGSRNSYPS
jgi:hypothetical protein